MARANPFRQRGAGVRGSKAGPVWSGRTVAKWGDGFTSITRSDDNVNISTRAVKAKKRSKKR